MMISSTYSQCSPSIRGPSRVTHRSVRWRIHAQRADFGTEPERIERDPEGDRFVERFAIERLS